MIKVIIYGATAVGKTDLAIKLAKFLDAEIISADSRQVYKYLDIGTAKEKDHKGIKHHVIDIIEPGEEYNVSKFIKMAKDIIENLEKRGKNLIVVGGTALYIKALLEGISDAPSRNPKLTEFLEKKHLNELLHILKELDEKSFALYKENKQRVVRAIEVFLQSGKTFSKYKEEKIKPLSNFYKYYIHMDRQKLYKRIDKRVDKMIDKGLIEESKSLFNKGFNLDNIIGYKQIFDYIKGEKSLDKSIDDIKKFTKNYAKRQITWSKKLLFDTIDIENVDPFIYITEDIKNKESSNGSRSI